MILDDIVRKRKERYLNCDVEKVKKEALKLKDVKSYFNEALRKDKMAFICEVKKASPSKGLIKENFNYIEIAKEYELSGASVISCLTEPDFFLGSDQYLINLKKEVNIPILRKDFIFSEYQIYESKIIGADAILLICAILEETELLKFYNLARSLNLGVLVECHNEEEINMALRCNCEVIGVNNRDLKTFCVDTNNSIRLRKLVDPKITFVSESGIKTKEDIKTLANANCNAVLIGETLMKSEDISLMLKGLMNYED